MTRCHSGHPYAVRRDLRGASVLAAVVCAIGCAPQATTEYEGDALFSMTGRVEVPLTSASESPLIPSIAFLAPRGADIRFLDAEVQGEFPAEFQIDLHMPPPAETVQGFSEAELASEPAYAIGYISAVAEDHLPALYYGSQLVGTGNACEPAGCSQTFDVTGDGHSGTMTVFCEGETPEMPAPPTACAVSGRTGDPMFSAVFLDPMFAGAVTNYVVGYLESEAPAGSVVAHRFGAPQGLSAGYHLLRVSPIGTEAEEQVKQTCRDEALQLAAERYNTAHGTDLHVVPGSIGIPTELRGEWMLATAEADCLIGPEYTPVEDPSSEPVSLQVSPGLSFALATLLANGGL